MTILTSLMRVGASALVAALAGLLAHANIHLGTADTGAITVAVMTVGTGLVLGLIHGLEKKLPLISRLLPVKGAAPAPVSGAGQPPAAKTRA